MPDFAPSPFAAFSEALEAHINHRLEWSKMEDEPRDYLGGSRLGEECLRMLGYEYQHTSKDEGRDFSGQTYRIFDMGHDGEKRMAEYLRKSGFQLLTERPDGHQFGFGVAPHPDTGRSRIAGHIDGVIISCPPDFSPDANVLPPHERRAGIAVPCLWENKALGNKSWNDVLKKGLHRSKPVYFSQMQTYMGYLGLAENPGLFTALNRDTGQIYGELVPFDAAAAQEATDRGVKVISARDPSELPRVAAERTDFRCKFCPYASRCWAAPTVAPAAEAAPGWMRKQ